MTDATDGGACAAAGAPITLRARIGVGAGDTDKKWIDLDVTGRPADAMFVCEALLQEEVTQISPDGTLIPARVVRPCASARLPPAAGGPFVLVAPRRQSAAQFLAGLRGDPCPTQRWDRVRAYMSLSHRASREACEQDRQRVIAAHRVRLEEMRRGARDSDRDQLAAQEQKERELCAAVIEPAKIARAQVAAQAEHRKACRKGTPSARCDRALRRFLALEGEEAKARWSAQDCANARALVGILRARLRAPPGATPESEQPFCRAE